MVVEPIPRVRPLAGLRTCFETQSRAGSYGFRPGRGLQEPALAKAGDALREVDRLLKAGFTWVVDADPCLRRDRLCRATSTASRTTGYCPQDNETALFAVPIRKD